MWEHPSSLDVKADVTYWLVSAEAVKFVSTPSEAGPHGETVKTLFRHYRLRSMHVAEELLQPITSSHNGHTLKACPHCTLKPVSPVSGEGST